MIATQENEIWRTIPPEEKFALIAKAQGSGVLAALVNIVTLTAIAVGLKQTWLIWTSLFMAPLVFQFVAGKAWRKLRPKAMLEYLAARSVARRFAFNCNSKDLTLGLIFRGTLEEVFGEDQVEESLNAIIDSNNETAVWIALFNDAVVMMSESEGGATLQFAHLINDRILVESRTPQEYNKTKELLITFKGGETQMKQFRLTSPFQAALVVFERRFAILKHEIGKNQLAVPIPAKAKEMSSMVFGE